MKEVNICGKPYQMNCSVLTIANYCNIFGMEANFGKDFSEASMYYDKLAKCYEPLTDKDGKFVKAHIKEECKFDAVNYSTNLVLLATRLAYVFIRECDATFMPYDEWVKTLNNLDSDMGWIKEVVGIASNVFRGSL